MTTPVHPDRGSAVGPGKEGRVRLLVFAHVPPPVHGQSQMVAYMIDGLRQRPGLGIDLEHVDARLSEDLADVGQARKGKIGKLLGYCMRAWKLRFVRGVRVLYYVPSPPKRASLYRDWIAMALLRPFFPVRVFHWHAVGLGQWLEQQARPWERWLSHRLLGQADLALVLTAGNAADAARFRPRRVAVVGNGVPDPFPDYERTLGPDRDRRWHRWHCGDGVIRVLFMALCSEDKGILDAVRMVALLRDRLRMEGDTHNGSGTRPSREVRLQVAGTFPDGRTEQVFQQEVDRLGMGSSVDRLGFVSGAGKFRALSEADLFLFPTYYSAEGQPINLMEACAAGLPVVTTRWRGIPEMWWGGFDGLVPVHDVDAGATALRRVLDRPDPGRFRRHYEECFSLDAFCSGLARAVSDPAAGLAAGAGPG
jgi:glycosyltransferase involved in cell wall biosynthesis